jgi:Uma2 family endonuclease
MSIALQEPIAPPAAATEPVVDPVYGPVYRVSVEQYVAMIRANILTDEDRAELLEGVIVAKSRKNPPHVLATRLILAALARVLPAGCHVSKEDPIQTTDSVPEPDCCVIRGDRRDYLDRYPGLGEMALVVEVSNTTLSRDRGSKMRLYARANIPVYWLVNLISGRIEVYSEPTGPTDRPSYRVGWSFGPGEEVPVVLDGREIARLSVRDLLP